MKAYLLNIACAFVTGAAFLDAEPLRPEDVSTAPLWFAHVNLDDVELGDTSHSLAGGEALGQLLKLRKLLIEAHSVKLESIHGITVFGADLAGKETCFLFRGDFKGVRLGDPIGTFPMNKGQDEITHSLHRGPQWLGEGWYLCQESTGAIVGANSLSALKGLILNRGQMKNMDAPDRVKITATQQDIRESTAVLFFNVAAIHREFGMESNLCGALASVLVLITQHDTGDVTGKLILEAKDAEEMKVITSEVNLLLSIVRAHENAAVSKAQAEGSVIFACWSKVESIVEPTRYCLVLRGEPAEIAGSLQALKKLFPQKGEK